MNFWANFWRTIYTFNPRCTKKRIKAATNHIIKQIVKQLVVILVRQGKLTYSDLLVAQILKKERKKRTSFLRTVKTQSVSATFHNEVFTNTLEENASKPVPMSFQSIYFCLSGMIQLHNLLRPFSADREGKDH